MDAGRPALTTGPRARQALIRRGWSAEAISWLDDDDYASDDDGGLWVPTRDVEGAVTGWVALDGGTWSADLPWLGDMREAAASFGLEPVVLAWTPADWLAARAMVARVGGVAVGVPVIGQLVGLVRVLAAHAEMTLAELGEPELWFVPPSKNTADARDAAEVREAARIALDWARVRLPARLDASMWRLIGDQHRLAGRWHESPLMVDPTDVEWRVTTVTHRKKVRVQALLCHLYRLPLHEAIRACHWKFSEKHGHQFYDRRQVTDADLVDVVVRWLDEHDVQLFADDEDQPWAYWWRELLPLGSKMFQARLLRYGKLNGGTSQGRAVLWALEREPLTRPRRSVVGWCWSRVGADGMAESRMALGDGRDRVAVARAGQLEVVRNAREGSVVHRPPAHPLPWPEAPTLEAWSELLYARLGRWQTCAPHMRSLAVSWALAGLLGRQMERYLPVRPILRRLGKAGSAKTMSAELDAALVYGSRETLLAPTPRSLMAMAADRPLLIIDNAEQEMQGREFKQLLLLAFRGGKRSLRDRETSRGVIEQQIDAWFEVTSIEGDDTHEAQTRCLYVEHDLRWGDDAHDEHDPPSELVADRGALLHGAMRAWAMRVLPRLAGDEHRTTATRIVRGEFPTHPLKRMAVTLGTLSVIADVLCQLDSRWGPGGEALLRLWLGTLAETTEAMMASTDPVGSALRLLLRQANAVDAKPGSGYWQPFLESESTAPVDAIYRADGGGLTLRSDAARSRRALGGEWPVVCGFVGTYVDLHAALTNASRNAGSTYPTAIKNANILATRLAHTEGWASAPVGRLGRGGPRVFAWWWCDQAAVPDSAERRRVAQDLGWKRGEV